MIIQNILGIFKKEEDIQCEKFEVLNGSKITPSLAGKINRMCKSNMELKKRESKLESEIWSLKRRVDDAPVKNKYELNDLHLARKENATLSFKLGTIENRHKQSLNNIKEHHKSEIRDLNKRNKHNMSLMHKTLKRLLPDDMSVPDYIKLPLKDWKH